MTTSVNVNMRVCDKTCRITASHRSDGDDIVIVSNCDKLQQLGEALREGVSMNDIMDVYSSRIMTRMTVGLVLTPSMAPVSHLSKPAVVSMMV